MRSSGLSPILLIVLGLICLGCEVMAVNTLEKNVLTQSQKSSSDLIGQMNNKNKILNKEKNKVKGKEAETDDEIMAFNASVSIKKVM